jgi:hypothetical protein
MTIDDYVWILISEKLSGEISTAGLKELEALQQERRDIHECVQKLENIIKPSREKDVPDQKAAFLKHIQRMQQLVPDFPGKKLSENINNK